MICQHAGLTVERFCAVAGIPRPTWYRQRERARGGRSAKGPWPRPARDRVQAVVHAYALRYPAWGHRKIWALTIADGHQVSMRTVHRILDERGLVHPHPQQAERRELAKARQQTFHEPPTRRNRVWQTDFSELETRASGTCSSVVFWTTSPSSASPAKSPRPRLGATPSARWTSLVSAPQRCSATR